MSRIRTPTLFDVYGYNGTICGYWGAGDHDHPPWENTPLNDVTYDKIDKLILTEYGDRPVGKFLQQYIEDDGTISPTSAQYIARYLLDIFRAQWERLTADYTAEYNPVQNYDMTETETGNDTNSGTDTSTDSFNNYKEVQKYGHTVVSANQAYPYDSDTPHDTDTNTTTMGAEGDSGDEFSKSGAMITEFEHGRQTDYSRTLTRAGNIGVQTATDMLRSDTEFWENHNFFETIAADIGSFLTIPIYE